MNIGSQRDTRRHRKARLLLEPAVTGQGGTWADIGCGDGVFTGLLFELLLPGSEVYAVDQSHSVLQRLPRNLPGHVPADKLHLVQADFTHPLSLPPLDGMVLANALHFVRHKAPVLRQLTGLLTPDGRLVVMVTVQLK